MASDPTPEPARLLAMGTRAREIAAVLVVLGAAAVRLVAAWRGRYAGHADFSFYYQVARNLRAGHGLTIDYVWHFHPAPTSVHHYAADYWMPLCSVAMALLMPVSGVRGALAVGVLWSVLGSAAAYWLARELTQSRRTSLLVAGLVALSPLLTANSMETDTAVYATVLVTAALAAILAAPRNRLGWPVAGALVGLAVANRSDGVLLAAPLVVMLGIGGRPGARLRSAASAGASALAVLCPLLVANVVEGHRLVPSNLRQVVFNRSPEDLYSVGPASSLRSWLRGSWTTKAHVRLDAAGSFFREPWSGIGALAAVTLAAGVLSRVGCGRRRDRPRATVGDKRRSPWLIPLTLIAAAFVVLTQVTPVLVIAGTWTRSAGVVPILALIAALDGVALASRGLRSRFGSALLASAVLLLGVPWATGLSGVANRQVASDNAYGDEVARITPLLRHESEVLGHPVVVMTRFPWEVNEVTGYAAVQVPNNGLQTILRTGRRYHADLLLLPAPRAAFANISRHIGPGRAFEMVGSVGRWTLLRITGAREEPPAAPHPGLARLR